MPAQRLTPAPVGAEPELSGGAKAARVFLVDDHAFFLRALRTLIDQEPDLEVCGTAGDSNGLLEKLRDAAPSIVVMDVHLRAEDGVALACQLRGQYPDLPIVFLTSCQAAEVRSRARQISASVIEKSQAPNDILQELRNAIRNDALRKQSKLVT